MAPNGEQIADRIRARLAESPGGDVEPVIEDLVNEGAPESVVREIAAGIVGEADEVEAAGGRV